MAQLSSWCYSQHPNSILVDRAVPYTRFPRNASFFPRGDLDPTRVSKRIKHTTTGTTHARVSANIDDNHTSRRHVDACMPSGILRQFQQRSGYGIPSPQPPSGSYPHHVDGSNLHTFSRVHLGGSRFYRYSTFGSTMADSYPPLSAPTHRIRAPSRDNIPLNYCSGRVAHQGHINPLCDAPLV